jgi:hypothetical protein
MTQFALPAKRAAHSPPMDGLARFGLTARGIVYILIGWLGLQIALGHHPHQANQRGALAEVAKNSLGLVLLWVIGFGLGAYALWRFSCAAFGSVHERLSTADRLQSAVRGVVYAALCISTFSFITGASRTSQAKQQATLTARVMSHTFGRWLVGAVGLVIVGIGIYLVINGLTRRFEKELRTDEMSERVRHIVVRIGAVGSIARGVVFGVAGGLAVAAAITFDPHKSTGLDGALRTLAGQSYGPWVVGALAIGLIAFGVFGLASARWAKT